MSSNQTQTTNAPTTTDGAPVTGQGRKVKRYIWVGDPRDLDPCEHRKDCLEHWGIGCPGRVRTYPFGCLLSENGIAGWVPFALMFLMKRVPADFTETPTTTQTKQPESAPPARSSCITEGEGTPEKNLRLPDRDIRIFRTVIKMDVKTTRDGKRVQVGHTHSIPRTLQDISRDEITGRPEIFGRCEHCEALIRIGTEDEAGEVWPFDA